MHNKMKILLHFISYQQEHQEHHTCYKTEGKDTSGPVFSDVLVDNNTLVASQPHTRWWGVTKHIMRLGLGGESSAQTGPSVSLWAR